MTKKEKIEYLRKYLDLEPEIIHLQNEIKKWRSVAEKSTPTFCAAGSGNIGADRLQAAVEQIAVLESQLAGELEKAVSARRDVEAVIKTVQNIRFQTMMRFRYVEGMPFEQIAEIMGRSSKQIHRWHENILMSLNVRVSA